MLCIKAAHRGKISVHSVQPHTAVGVDVNKAGNYPFTLKVKVKFIGVFANFLKFAVGYCNILFFTPKQGVF